MIKVVKNKDKIKLYLCFSNFTIFFKRNNILILTVAIIINYYLYSYFCYCLRYHRRCRYCYYRHRCRHRRRCCRRHRYHRRRRRRRRCCCIILVSL